MKILQQLTFPLLVVTSSLAFLSHGMPQASSITDNDPSISKRDDTSYYVVFAKNSSNETQTTAITNLLESVVSDPKNVSVHGSDLGVAFWSAPLTSDNAEKVGADSNVSSVVKGCTENCPDPTESGDPDAGNTQTKRSSGNIVPEDGRLVKRDDGLVNSHKIDKEMVFISLPDRAELDDYEDFVYEKSAGTNVMVYIVDTGAHLFNDDEFSSSFRANVRWLHAAGAFPRDTTESDIKLGIGHGTGVLAKAAGWKHGIAKRSNPVVVRVNKLSDPAAYLDGVVRAYLDWKIHHYTGNEKTATGVLNLSWGWKRDTLIGAGYNPTQQIDWVTELRRYLNACIAIGLLPIAPSGNGPNRGPDNVAVDEYPQLFAYGNPPDVPDMMVVGGIGTNGKLWERSKVDPPNQNKVIKVHAPCYDITIPNTSGGYRAPAEVQGVSYASGTIAGLGAYFLGLSSLYDSLHDDDPTKRVRKLKDELESGSCIERIDGICALHNLADPRKCPPDPPLDFQDGDEVGCKSEDSEEPTTTSGICVQQVLIDDKPAMTCSTSTRGFPATPLAEGNFECTNFCFCKIEGKDRGCEHIPNAKARREAGPVLTGAPVPTAAPL